MVDEVLRITDGKGVDATFDSVGKDTYVNIDLAPFIEVSSLLPSTGGLADDSNHDNVQMGRQLQARRPQRHNRLRGSNEWARTAVRTLAPHREKLEARLSNVRLLLPFFPQSL